MIPLDSLGFWVFIPVTNYKGKEQFRVQSTPLQGRKLIQTRASFSSNDSGVAHSSIYVENRARTSFFMRVHASLFCIYGLRRKANYLVDFPLNS